MKKSVLFAGLAACVLSFNAMAGSSEMFSLDENSVNAQFQGLTQLENFVNQHEGVTLSEMKATGNTLLTNLNPSDAKGILGTLTLLGGGDLPLGIPAFVWGLCFQVAGVAIVYFVTDDKSETMSAVWGCVTISAAYILFYVVYFVVFAAAVVANTP